jgi:hypothetical protein
MIAHYEDTRRNTFFSQLINLKQKGSVTENIENFQRLNIKVIDIPDEHLIDVFIGTLKDNIQHEVRLWEPKSLENAFKMARNVEIKSMAMATRRTNPNIYRENNAPSPKTPQPTRLTPQQLEERKEKGLCFNFDSKYNKGHKCGERYYWNCTLKQKVLLELHTSPVGGYSGFLKTNHRVKKDFFWDGLKTNVQRFVAKCLVCQ